MSSFERRQFRDQLSIDTPEQVDLRFHVAGIGSRFVAQLLDLLIVLAFFLVEALVVWAVVAASLAGGGSPPDFASHWTTAILVLVNFAVVWGYFSGFESWWNGQTPGKRAMKLRVIKDSGRQITFFESLARNLVRVIDYFPGMYLTGVIAMLCNQRNKRLGDFVAGTIVVHEQPGEQPLLAQSSSLLSLQARSTWQPEMQAPSVPAMFAADAIARLGAPDLIVIEAFFARVLDLPLDTRAAMAQRIARQMAAKMDVPLPEGNPERALESIAHALRSGASRLA